MKCSLAIKKEVESIIIAPAICAIFSFSPNKKYAKGIPTIGPKERKADTIQPLTDLRETNQSVSPTTVKIIVLRTRYAQPLVKKSKA